MNKIFISGGNGYIGKNFLKKFSEKYQIISPSRQILDLSHTESVNQYFGEFDELDCVLNAVSIAVTRNSLKSGQDSLSENLKIFRNIFQHASNAKRFIQFGSGAEYSKPFTKKNMREEDAGKNLPQDAYGLSKFFAGQLLELQQPGKFVNLRIFGVFGPYEDYRTRFISNAIVRSLLDLPIVVNQNALFDYVYIQDFLKILDYFIQNPAPHISYNITTGQSITLIELAEIVHRLTNNKHAIIVKNANIKENYTGDNGRLMQFLPADFKFTPIESAIAELIHWYESAFSQNNKEKYLEDIQSIC